MLWLWIVLGVLALVAILGVVSYNRFVSQKQLIKDSWANIDTELRRRYDLIPNLVETVRGYATHEREVFENVTRARAAAAVGDGHARARRPRRKDRSSPPCASCSPSPRPTRT